MDDLSTTLGKLERPRMLVSAARRGLGLYRRETDLPKLTGSRDRKNAAAALIANEADLEGKRTRGDSGYSVARHIWILTALLAEARLSRAPV